MHVTREIHLITATVTLTILWGLFDNLFHSNVPYSDDECVNLSTAELL